MQFSEVLRQSLGQWSHDGRYFAAAAQNRVLVREPETLKLVQVYVCIDKVERIEWSPDSEFLLTEVARQGIVQLWSLRDSEWTCRVDEGLAGVSRACWGPTSKHLLVVADFQLYMSVWTLDDPATVEQIRHPKFAKRGRAFSRNGNWLALLRRCDCKDILSVYNAGDDFTRFAEASLPGDSADLAWGPDDETVILWDRPGRQCLCHVYSIIGEHLAEIGDCGLPRFVSPSPSAQLLVAAGLDGRIQLLSAVARRKLACFAHDLQAAIAEVGDAGEVSILEEEFEASAESLGGVVNYKRLVTRADIAMEERPGSEAGVDADGLPKQGVAQAVWSPDERFLATKLENFPGVVWVWDMGRLVLAAVLKHRSPVRCFAWDPSHAASGESSRLAVTTADPIILIWSPEKSVGSACPLSLARLQWRQDGRSLLLQERDRACLYQLGLPLPSAGGGGVP
eukprot:gb/GFBE01052891.1/.p1 GENE.gb/GFBE01052891.1/~~gb/GFBE01052891.1/.p1  ORF type:complete len:452 (+),score=76.12 gb/GFBE01052891.1/:1-1356(+)